MELKDNIKKAKIFRSKQEIERLLMEHAQSGLSMKSFCAGLHIDDSTFYNWKKKYSKEAGKAGFAPIEIVTSACNTLFAEVGAIKIYQPVSAAYLKELLV